MTGTIIEVLSSFDLISCNRATVPLCAHLHLYLVIENFSASLHYTLAIENFSAFPDTYWVSCYGDAIHWRRPSLPANQD